MGPAPGICNYARDVSHNGSCSLGLTPDAARSDCDPKQQSVVGWIGRGRGETDVERADIAIEPTWYPAVENRGEAVFLQLRSESVDESLERDAIRQRVVELQRGHTVWAETRRSTPGLPGGAYILLHTLAHLLIQSLAMRCGYPASSIRERVYTEEGRYGILLYTGTPDAEGTLGGLVQQGRYVEDHLAEAMRGGELCSNDPRSLSLDGPAAVLHAKAVVADGEAVFVTSANLTGSAWDENIELGVLARDHALATSVAAHFQGLIDGEILMPLPIE